MTRTLRTGLIALLILAVIVPAMGAAPVNIKETQILSWTGSAWQRMTKGDLYSNTNQSSLAIGGGYGSTGCTIAATGNLSTNGTLTVDGASTLTGATTQTGALAANGGITCDTSAFTVADTSGNVATTGTLAVTGLSTLTGGLITGTGYSGTGATITNAGVIQADGAVTFGSTLAVTGTATLSGAVTAPVLATITDSTDTVAVGATHYGKTTWLTHADAVAVDAPAVVPAAGTWAIFALNGNDSLAVTFGVDTADDNLIAPNNASADSVTFGAGHRIGARVMYLSDGTAWHIYNLSSGCTMTVTDAG